jgi:hypothetical protein
MPAKNRHRVYSKKETSKQKKRVFVKRLERVQIILNPFAFGKSLLVLPIHCGYVSSVDARITTSHLLALISRGLRSDATL